jgi:acyl carrier protein
MMPTTITPEQVTTLVVDSLASFGAERDEIQPSTKLAELDVDSLDLAELSQIVEDEYGVNLKSTDVAEIRTVGDAIDLIVARLQ